MTYKLVVGLNHNDGIGVDVNEPDAEILWYSLDELFVKFEETYNLKKMGV